MDLIRHLQISAKTLFPRADGELGHQHRTYVDGFQAHLGSTETERLGGRHEFNVPNAGRRLLLREAQRRLESEQFDVGAGADYDRGFLEAKYIRDFAGTEGWLAFARKSGTAVRLMFEVRLVVHPDGRVELRTSRKLPSWFEEFHRHLLDVLRNTPDDLGRFLDATERRLAPPRDLILAPKDVLDGPSEGTLLDYSGCAAKDSVADLQAGDLPLGRWAFGFAPTRDTVTGRFGVDYGPEIFLSRYRTGQPMIYNGALICAPQNSGKTRLIIRWALAANRRGYSVLLIDVKGTLFKELSHQLQGRVCHFSTDPELDECDGLNFLAGLEGNTPLDRVRVRHLVDALLPRDGWEAGEQAYFYQNHVNWLTALIQIVLLNRSYFPSRFIDGEADLSYVFDLASDEALLLRALEVIETVERQLPAERRIEPGAGYWKRELAVLIDPQHGGQRTADYSYRTLTQSLTNALRPFSRLGTLYAKTSKGRIDAGPLRTRRFFTLDELDLEREPVTIILAAREQDVDDATTVVSMVVRRLQHTLFGRMTRDNARPIVLLLDETRRIRGFAPDEYITFARQAQAGCVIAYQSLDQIGDDRKIRIILENVGVQIYLGSLVGETARHFINLLPKRGRPTFSRTTSRSNADASVAIQTGEQLVDYLSTAELYRLPAGEWPALVYINAQPRRDPILVDLDQDAGRRAGAPAGEVKP